MTDDIQTPKDSEPQRLKDEAEAREAASQDLVYLRSPAEPHPVIYGPRNALQAHFDAGWTEFDPEPTYDDETLTKVYDALQSSGLTQTEAQDAVSALQNAGILFRERA